MTEIVGHFNYAASLVLILFGIYIMITEQNYVRKVIGMAILQTCVILFYISVAYKAGAAIPILTDPHAAVETADYANPLPHALMLTAIVVGVSTLGVAMVLIIQIYRNYRTLEENKILEPSRS